MRLPESTLPSAKAFRHITHLTFKGFAFSSHPVQHDLDFSTDVSKACSVFSLPLNLSKLQ